MCNCVSVIILPLIIYISIYCGCSSKKSYRQIPHLAVLNGNPIFYAADNKNITFKTTSSAGIFINDIDLLTTLNKAYNATRLVDSYQKSFTSYINRIDSIEQRVSDSPIQWKNNSNSDLIDPHEVTRLNTVRRFLRKKITHVEAIVLQNECASNPCKNGGTCQDLLFNYICRCSNGWEGTDCSEDVNECVRFGGSDLGCQNGATCIDKPGTYECVCQMGYVGIHCTSPKADCDISGQELCGHGTCVQQHINIGYKCICDQGWTTDGTNQACTADVNECDSNHPVCSKDPAVPCINVPGSFYCGACPTGYTGNGFYCVDINECEINNGGCSLYPRVDCINTQGSRICGLCPPGYVSEGVTCVFRGVCQVNNGGCNYLARCKDNPRISSSYVECVCPIGYVGTGIGPNGCTFSPSHFNPCAPNPCTHGTCSVNNITADYICSCDKKFTGRNCDVMRDPCASAPCQNGGTCLNAMGISFQCLCSGGFSGTLCDVEMQGCDKKLYGLSGVLKYPLDDYETYGHRIICSWTIETNSTKIVNITFNKFHISASKDCQSDWLKIFDGPNSASRLLGRFCGTDLPLGGRILTTSNVVYFTFSLDAGSAETGFNLTWNATDPACGGEITAVSHGVIESPGSPGNYSSNQDCYWRLSAPDGKRLLFHFFSLNMDGNADCNPDFIEFCDMMGNEDNATFAKFCNGSLPEPFYSPNREVKVHYRSVEQNSRRGFYLTYLVAEGVPGCGGYFGAERGTIPTMQPAYDKHERICEFKIRQGHNSKTKITFLNMNLVRTRTCFRDYIEVREGLGRDSPLVGRYCDRTLPPPYISNGPLTIISATSIGSDWAIKYEKFCGDDFFNNTGSFNSSSLRTNKRDCIYRIGRPLGYVIELVVTLSVTRPLHREKCLYGYIEIRDGDHKDAPVIMKFCETRSEIFTSTYNHLWIRYYQVPPAHLDFEATYTSLELECGGILRNKSGSISPPEHPDEYALFLRCSWVIIAPPKSVIKLVWIFLNLESSYKCVSGNVRVFDNSTDLGEGEMIENFCDSNLPPMLLSTDNIMTIVFTTINPDKNSFLATYSFVSKSNVCGGGYFTSTGVIRFPYYPRMHSSVVDCTWTITVPSGQQILLNVTDFDLGSHKICVHDWLEIRHGNSPFSPLIGKYCGITIPKRIVSHFNQLYLHLKIGMSKYIHGFKVIWSSTATGCGGTLSLPRGSIASPYYPEPYGKNTDCVWQIIVAVGSRIQIMFPDIDIKFIGSCGKYKFSDYIELFDGFEINSRSLGKFCSSGARPIVSSGNKVLVKFRSYYVPRDRGFLLQYFTDCHNTLTGFGGVIESPNFSGEYPQGLTCLWDIIVNQRNQINITFSYFESDYSTNKSCDSDYVEIKYWDESFTIFNRLNKFCGADNPGLVTVNSDHAQIHFVHTRSTLKFRLEWQLVGCGGILTESSGSIQSPNYPKMYPQNIKCQWRIKVPFANSIKIYFSEIILGRIGCSANFIGVYNGPDNSSNVISMICHSGKSVELTNTGNQMFVEFQAVYFEAKGFNATYEAISKNCGGKFTAPEGNISSLNYPKTIDGNDTCFWLIETEESHSIELTFLDVGLPQDCDKYNIKVYDGSSEKYPILETVCNTAPNGTVNSTFNKMFVVFRMMGTGNTFKGFLAKYRKECGSRITTAGSGNIQISSVENKNYLFCTWTIVSTDPTRRITLIITQLQWQDSGIPSIKIYGGETSESPLMKTIDREKAPPPIVSDGSAITIWLMGQMDFFATYSVFDSHCGGMFDSSKGFFASPGYPNIYPSDMQCEWTIKVTSGNRISITFHEFDLVESEHCNLDFLEIRRYNNTGPLLGIYCGNNKPLNITHEETVWILFKGNKLEKDVSVTAKGFYGEYELDHNIDLTGPHGFIASPLYPRMFHGRHSISWKITVGQEKRISLTVRDFYTDSIEYRNCIYMNFDIFDGVDRKAPLLKSVCNESPPDPIKSSANVVYIALEHYYHMLSTKFLVEWLEINNDLGVPIIAAPSPGASCGVPEVIDISKRNSPYNITSPGYPNGYKANLKCQWTFSTIPMNHLSVDLEDVNLGTNSQYYNNYLCHNDYVSFYEKSSEDNDWKLIKKACRRGEEFRNRQFTGLLRVEFGTNHFPYGSGFKAKISQRCGGSMGGSTGVIYLSENNTLESGCEWIVTVQSSRTMRVTFEKLDINRDPTRSCDNYFTLRNGKYPNSPPLGNGKYCGIIRPEPLITTGNNLYVRYNGSTNITGFTLKYQEISVECGGNIILSLLESSVEISSPNYPETAPFHIQCLWMIRAPPGESLMITFEKVFSGNKDYVELRDGGTDLSPLIGRYYNETPSTQFSTDSVIFVKFFRNDYSPAGFQANISLTKCGGTIRDDSWFIESPPQQLKTSKLYCTWHIVGSAYGHFSIEFVELKLDGVDNASGRDNKITVWEENQLFDNVTKIAEYDENVLPPPLTVLTNKVLVTYVGSNMAKFRLKFTANKLDCFNNVIRAESGEITSPDYLKNYGPLMCQWTIEVPEGRRITFDIVDSDVNITDIVYVTDGPTKNLKLAPKAFALPQKSFESSSNKMTVSYFTNLTYKYHRGFKAIFSSNKPTVCASDFTKDSGVLTQPALRNNLYWCSWTHDQNIFLNQTLALTINLHVNATESDKFCFHTNWSLVVTDQEDRDIVQPLCRQSLVNYTVQSVFPVTKIVVSTRVELNFTISYNTYDCGGMVNDQEGFISSPSFPNETSRLIECNWMIRVDEEQTVNLTVLSMDLGDDCEKSFIVIYNGDRALSPAFGKYCGTNKPDAIISQSNSLSIEYRNEKGANGTGFRLKYEARSEGCGGIYHDRERIIQTPNYGRNYPNNAECLWELRSDPGYSIRLHFIERFQIEVSRRCINDFVEVWDWQGGKWISVAKECGRNIPDAVQSKGDKIKILFRSNERITGGGFKAKWEWTCGGTFEATHSRRTIVSPGYPLSYDGPLNCEYNIVTEAEVVVITFDDFELRYDGGACRFDSVRIKGFFQWGHSALHKYYCGTIQPPYVRLEKSATIVFKTSSHQNKRGFRLTYYDDECGGNVTEAKIIKGPSPISKGDPKQYFISCVWNIIAPPKQIAIISILYMNLQDSCYSYRVDIFKSLNDQESNRLAWLCGEITDVDPIFVESGSMLVKLNVATRYYKGFEAEVYFSHGADEGCGGNVNLTETKYIQAPDLEDMDCRWRITAPRDYQIQIQFTELNLPDACTGSNTSCSFIKIRDGLGPFSELIEQLGSKSNSRTALRKIKTSLHRGYIRFLLMGRRSNAFKATLTPVLSVCGPSILNATREIKILTSPGYPGKYPPDIRCSWEIITESRRDSIELHFTDFNLTESDSLRTCDGDRVEIAEDPHKRIITEGLGPQAMFSGSKRSIFLNHNRRSARHIFCGDRDSLFDYYSLGKSVTLTFKSLVAGEHGRGFKLEYGVAGCNRNYTSLQGRLLSDFMETDCIITIIVPKNRTISLYFNRFLSTDNANCNGTHFEVRDGDVNGSLLMKSCGVRAPAPVFSFTNKLYIRLRKKPHNMLLYDVGYTSTDAGRGCGGVLYNYKGKVSSPLYPSEFKNDTVCRWVIRVPVGLYAALKFVDIDLKGSCDENYVRVTTYTDNDGLVRTFCKHDQPVILHSNSEINIEYSSSAQNDGRGWMANFQGVEDDTLEIR